MKYMDRSFLHHLNLLAVATLIATSAAWGAQIADPPAEAPPAQAPVAQEPAPPPQPTVPQVTGTIVRVTESRIDLKTKDGKDQKVALNDDTERLVEVKKGTEVTVEYRRRIGDFVIAERVLAPGTPAAEPVPAPVLKTGTATGDVLSATEASLVLRAEDGDLTFFLSPSTEILVKPITPGLRVAVDYREDKEQTKVATRIIPAAPEEPAETPPPADPAPPGE